MKVNNECRKNINSPTLMKADTETTIMSIKSCFCSMQFLVFFFNIEKIINQMKMKQTTLII